MTDEQMDRLKISLMGKNIPLVLEAYRSHYPDHSEGVMVDHLTGPSNREYLMLIQNTY